MGLSVHLTRRGPTFGEARDFLGFAVLALPLALGARFQAMGLLVAHLAAVVAGAQLPLLALLVADVVVVVAVVVVAPAVASFSVLLVALVARGLLVTLS